MKLLSPNTLDYDEVFQFSSALERAIESSELIIDLSQLTFARPFGSLLLSHKIRQIARARKRFGLDTRVSYYNVNSVVSYLSHIGFFKHTGVDKGNAPGVATGSRTYLPFHYITRKNLLSIISKDQLLGDAIEEESGKLASIILGISNTAPNHPVVYCFREAIRNTFEHANANLCTISAQKWRGGEIEIAIFDSGRGVREALNEKYNYQDDYSALSDAIKPGISRIDFGKQPDSYWANSGFGLYVLSELACRTKGSFLICSGLSALYKYGVSQVQNDYNFDGTAIRLVILKPSGIDMYELLRKIIKDGEAARPTGSRPASASTKSTF